MKDDDDLSDCNRLERFAVETLHLSHYRAALLVAYFRFVLRSHLSRENLLGRVRIT